MHATQRLVWNPLEHLGSNQSFFNRKKPSFLLFKVSGKRIGCYVAEQMISFCPLIQINEFKHLYECLNRCRCSAEMFEGSLRISSRQKKEVTITIITVQKRFQQLRIICSCITPDILSGDLPANSTFSLSQMQIHLSTCFQNVKFANFSHSPKQQCSSVKRQAWRIGTRRYWCKKTFQNISISY